MAANLRTKRKREDDLKWAKKAKAKQELSPGSIGPESAETSIRAVIPSMPVDSASVDMNVEFPSVPSEDERMEDIGSPLQSTDESFGHIQTEAEYPLAPLITDIQQGTCSSG